MEKVRFAIAAAIMVVGMGLATQVYAQEEQTEQPRVTLVSTALKYQGKWKGLYYSYDKNKQLYLFADGQWRLAKQFATPQGPKWYLASSRNQDGAVGYELLQAAEPVAKPVQPASLKLQEVTKENFEQVVLQSRIPVLVDFGATWCGPCRALAPDLEALAGDYQGRVLIVKVDVDTSPELKEQFGVKMFPTCLLFQQGTVQTRMESRQPKAAYESLLDEVLAGPKELDTFALNN